MNMAHFDAFWDIILIPLSWLPPFCFDVVSVAVKAFVVLGLLMIVVKVYEVFKK